MNRKVATAVVLAVAALLLAAAGFAFMAIRSGGGGPRSGGGGPLWSAGGAAATKDGLFVFSQWIDEGPGSDGSTAIYVARRDGTGVRRLTEVQVDGADHPRWSPDGSMIAYSDYDDNVDRRIYLINASGIYLMNPDASDKRPLPPVDVDGGLAWSADGSEIVFGRYGGGLGIVDANGNIELIPGLRQRSPWNIDWSRDGKQIAFDEEIYGGRLWVVNRDGTGLKKVSGHCREPRWSPDGKTLLCIDTNDGRIHLYMRNVWNAPMRKVVPISGTGTANWSSDSEKIECLSGSGIYTLDLSTGRTSRAPFHSPPQVCDSESQKYCSDFDWRPG